MLEISIKEMVPGIKAVTLKGELDLFEKKRVLSVLSSLLGDGPRGLIIDLSHVTVLASAGIEVLIGCSYRTKEAGISMALVLDQNNRLLKKIINLGFLKGAGLEAYKTVEEAEFAMIGK